MLINEGVGQDVLHIAGIEQRLFVQTIEGCIDLGIGNRFGYIFDTHNKASLLSHEVGNRSGTGVEVVDKFIAR